MPIYDVHATDRWTESKWIEAGSLYVVTTSIWFRACLIQKTGVHFPGANKMWGAYQALTNVNYMWIPTSGAECPSRRLIPFPRSWILVISAKWDFLHGRSMNVIYSVFLEHTMYMKDICWRIYGHHRAGEKIKMIHTCICNELLGQSRFSPPRWVGSRKEEGEIHEKRVE